MLTQWCSGFWRSSFGLIWFDYIAPDNSFLLSPQKRVVGHFFFLIFFINTCVVGTHLNCIDQSSTTYYAFIKYR